MTAQCRWLNTVQSAQSGCPAGIWFPIKFPKTSPAWIALRSPICAVRCCPHFRQQTGRRIPSLSRFGRIREAGGTQIFVTTSPPAADGRRLFCRGHASFQTPGRQGLSVQACCFRQQTNHAAQALCFLRFVRTVRGYNGGMAYTFILRYRCFCCPDCCKFSNFRWQITADSSSVSRSDLGIHTNISRGT